MSRRRPIRSVLLDLACVDPQRTGPGSPVEFGLQLGPTELQVGEPVDARTVRYTARVEVERRDDGTLLWRGPAIHGPARARFLYVSCRPRGASPTQWIFRLKVPLGGVTAALAGLDEPELSEVVHLVGTCRATRGRGIRTFDEDGWSRAAR